MDVPTIIVMLVRWRLLWPFCNSRRTTVDQGISDAGVNVRHSQALETCHDEGWQCHWMMVIDAC